MGVRTGNPAWVDSADAADAAANPGRKITAAKLNAIEDAIDATALVQISTVTLPESPTEGLSVSVLADSTTVLPEDVTWDSGGEPTITERMLLVFVWSGTDWVGTYGPSIPDVPAPTDTTPPTAGTLGVVPGVTTADLTVTGASDETALHATPYAFSTNNGSTWSAYQAGATYEATGLTADTSYTFRHKVRDAAGNETVGTAVTDSTDPAPADTTPPTAGTLAGSAITSSGFTLTVSGAADETALHATPYRFSTDDGATYSAWQSSAVYAATGLAASTGYTCKHQTRDAASNVSTGTGVVVTTDAAVTTMTDTFTRADSATTLGTADTGQTWEYVNSVWGISSNAAYMVSVTGNRGHANLNFGSADMKVTATFGVVSADNQYPSVAVRVADQDTNYNLNIDLPHSSGATTYLARRISGTQVVLGSYAIGAIVPTGATLELSAKEEGGSTRLRGVYNGVEVINYLDSTAGRPTASTRGGINCFTAGTMSFADVTIAAP